MPCIFERVVKWTLIILLAHAQHSGAWAAAANEARNAGIIDCTPTVLEKHNPDLASTIDQLVCFEAYVSNFDTGRGKNAAGKPEILGIPHWVTQHVKRAAYAPEARKRPRAWFTIPDLQKKGLAPTDHSYQFSQRFRQRHANWYERGHLAQKYLAERVSETAGWFTHNLANAVPQRARFNKGPWLTLECFTGAWANQYGEVWVVTGPVFMAGYASQWLRSDSNREALAVAIPDSLFKIVARKGSSGVWETLAFIYPQEHSSYRKGPWDPIGWLTSVSQIEKITGQEFLVGKEATPSKSNVAVALWSVKKKNFDPGCKRFAKEIP